MKNHNLLENKELLVSNFKQFESDNMKVCFSDIISNLIRMSEEMYVYRTRQDFFDEDAFIKWLITQNELTVFNQILMNFTRHKRTDTFIPKNNEKAYNLCLNKVSKEKIINDFRIFIRSSNEFYIKKKTDNLTNEDLHKNNVLSDQYDFIFTTGWNVNFWTDIHCFQFFIAEGII